MLSSSSLIKMKRCWSAWLGKMGKRGQPLYGSRSLLNMTLSLHHRDYLGWVISLMVIIPSITLFWVNAANSFRLFGLGYLLDGYHTYGISHHPLLWFWVNVANSFSVTDMFKRSHLLQYQKPSFSWLPFLNLLSSVDFHLQNHLTCFVSLMWDTSRPSYDESLLVDISTLSRKLT